MIFLIPLISVYLSLLRAILTALLILMIMLQLENVVGMFSAAKIKQSQAKSSISKFLS